VFDFGQNMAGMGSLRLPAATVVAADGLLLKYGEKLNADGSVNQPWCAGSGPDCHCDGINCANQTDYYIPDRSMTVAQGFTPSFTYHGFRYVQVEGLAADFVPTDDFRAALFVHTAVPPTGKVHFNESWDILNKIQTAILYTQQSNLHSHPTDCPTRSVVFFYMAELDMVHDFNAFCHMRAQYMTDTTASLYCREKRGWTGDSQLTSAEASLNFDMKLLYGNWLRTMRDHSDVGCVTHGQSPVFPQSNIDVCCDPTKPTFGCDYTGVPGGSFKNTSGAVADVVPFTYVGGWPGDPSWGIISAVLPWQVWRNSGDLSIVSEYYDVR